MQSDLPQLQSNLPQLQSNLPQMQSDLPQLQSDLPQMQSDLPQLQSDLPQLQSDLPQVGRDLPQPGRPANLCVVELPPAYPEGARRAGLKFESGTSRSPSGTGIASACHPLTTEPHFTFQPFPAFLLPNLTVLQTGTDIRTVQELLGHEDVSASCLPVLHFLNVKS
jgi:hypothetical protein